MTNIARNRDGEYTGSLTARISDVDRQNANGFRNGALNKPNGLVSAVDSAEGYLASWVDDPSHYDREAHSQPTPLLIAVLSEIPRLRRRLVMDAGAGGGGHSLLLAEKAPVVAVDISPIATGIISRKKAEHQEATGERLNLDIITGDVVEATGLVQPGLKYSSSLLHVLGAKKRQGLFQTAFDAGVEVFAFSVKAENDAMRGGVRVYEDDHVVVERGQYGIERGFFKTMEGLRGEAMRAGWNMSPEDTFEYPVPDYDKDGTTGQFRAAILRRNILKT